MSFTATWAALGASIYALFLHNILQPDDSIRNPGLMKQKLPSMSTKADSSFTQRIALRCVNAILVLGLTLIVGGLATTTSQGCKPAEEAIIQGVTQACTVLDSQPEPAWVYFTCAELDAAGNILASYTVKVPKEAAAKFTSDYPSATKISRWR